MCFELDCFQPDVKKKRTGLLEKLASGSVYVLTMLCIVTNSSDRAAAGF